ncbi:MAG: very short patch repair endonuclease [Candidatus Acidiferrales bacterium]
MDCFSSDQRSNIMRRVRSSGTRPERAVRSVMRQMGVRFRTCCGNLPGKPDVVIPSRKTVILVHGCFWHGHHCEAGRLPKANRSYWKSKQITNIRRDDRNAKALRARGWKIMTLWECQIIGSARFRMRLSRFLKEHP